MKLLRYPFQAMGSPCEIQLYAASQSRALQVAQAARAAIEQLERRYSRYRPDSLLSAINRAAAKAETVEIDAETASLLDYADVCFVESDGLFDITSGILRKAWRFDGDALPAQTRIDALLPYVGWKKIQRQPGKLIFTVPGQELDFGGIVKEYAADRAATLCLERGITSGAVNLGGDIRLIGPHPDGSPWRIGIRDPFDRGKNVTHLELFAGGLASSGDYERCIQVGDRRYGHILNPKTGWPVYGYAAVTVIAELCVLAGSAATIALLKERECLPWLDTLGLSYFAVDAEGRGTGRLAASEKR